MKSKQLHVIEFLLFPPPQRGARPMDYGKSKCWVTGHALGEHSRRLSNSNRPSTWATSCWKGTVPQWPSKTRSCAMPFLLQRDWLSFWTGLVLGPLTNTLPQIWRLQSCTLHHYSWRRFHFVQRVCRVWLFSQEEMTSCDIVIHEFSGLCSLPCCAGAMNGTFMKIEKPCKWGDAYFCCKKHMAIILFVCVGAREPRPFTGHGCLYALGTTCLLLLVSSLLAIWLGRSLGGAPLRALGKHYAPPWLLQHKNNNFKWFLDRFVCFRTIRNTWNQFPTFWGEVPNEKNY